MQESETTSWRQRLTHTTAPAPDDRSRMRAVANNLVLHLHPTKVPAPALRWSYTWGLGGISAVLVMVLMATGVLLMFRYEATVAGAYASVRRLESEVFFGSLIRGLHHWSANLLVITAFLHLLRVFYTGGYKGGRGLNWGIGLALLALVLTFSFTGYLLPWDQLAYWAITVGTGLLDYVPVLGPMLKGLLLGGPEVGETALRNFYAFHVAVLPGLLLAFMSYHFWRVRKDGGISQPEPDEAAPRQRVERVTTIPHLVRRELTATVVVIAGLVLFAALVPAPLEALADPNHAPNPAKAAWYFLGVQELLLHMHPLAALILPGIVVALIVTVPRWDEAVTGLGVYFRSANGRWMVLSGALQAAGLIPALVLLDEYWLDLPALLPGLPVLINTGLVPLLFALLLLAGVYIGLRFAGEATHGEAVLGLMTFVFVSFVLLTLVGIYFRGPGMALVLPW